MTGGFKIESNFFGEDTLLLKSCVNKAAKEFFRIFKFRVPMRKKINIGIGSALMAMMLFIAPLANANFLRADGGDGTRGVSSVMATYTAPASVVLTNTGQNTSTGYVTHYVLVNNTTQVIAYSGASPSFSNVPVGNYSAYAVNYNSQQVQPTLTVGTSFSAIGGECVQTSSAFPVIVTSGSAACTPASGGSTISATAVGNNTGAGYATRYVLTNASGVIQASNTTGQFTAPAINGEVRIYAVNYNTSGSQPVFTNGINIASVGLSVGLDVCIDISEPKCFDITTGSGACTNISSGQMMTAGITGNNTTAGYTTVYVMTNASGVIQQGPSATASFPAPSTPGEYRIYAVNYSGAAPTLSAGTNIGAIGGECAVASVPKCFNVTNVVLPCTNIQSGQMMTASISGNNTTAGYTTVYVMTNASGVIQQGPSATASFTAPSTAGEYRIYAVNYSGTAPALATGSNISTVNGQCVAVSPPKCFNVSVVVSPCTVVSPGQQLTAAISGNNTSAGYTTVYVLTNAAGVIQQGPSASASFTAPSTPGQEYRIYAVNYSGTAPVLSVGTNVSAVGGGCVALSNYKCFTVRTCPNPENNCLTATVTRIR